MLGGDGGSPKNFSWLCELSVSSPLPLSLAKSQHSCSNILAKVNPLSAFGFLPLYRHHHYSSRSQNGCHERREKEREENTTGSVLHGGCGKRLLAKLAADLLLIFLHYKLVPRSIFLFYCGSLSIFFFLLCVFGLPSAHCDTLRLQE